MITATPTAIVKSGTVSANANAVSVVVSKDIPNEFSKILSEFTKLDKDAGGGQEISTLIEKFKANLKIFNDEQLKIKQRVLQSAVQPAAQSTGLPPLVPLANIQLHLQNNK